MTLHFCHLIFIIRKYVAESSKKETIFGSYELIDAAKNNNLKELFQYIFCSMFYIVI